MSLGVGVTTELSRPVRVIGRHGRPPVGLGDRRHCPGATGGVLANQTQPERRSSTDYAQYLGGPSAWPYPSGHRARALLDLGRSTAPARSSPLRHRGTGHLGIGFGRPRASGSAPRPARPRGRLVITSTAAPAVRLVREGDRLRVETPWTRSRKGSPPRSPPGLHRGETGQCTRKDIPMDVTNRVAMTAVGVGRGRGTGDIGRGCKRGRRQGSRPAPGPAPGSAGGLRSGESPRAGRLPGGYWSG